MSKGLVFNKHTENLAEIAMVYAVMAKENPKLLEIESIEWKQQFIEWSNEFEEKYPDIEDSTEDYPEVIESFAKKKILGYAELQADDKEVIITSSQKQAYREIKELYTENDVCLGELLAGIKIHGLTVEEVVELYAALYQEIEGEKVERGGEILGMSEVE